MSANTIKAKAGTRTKPFWHSKTLWFNALAAALVALESGTGMLQPLLPVNFYTLIAVGLPVLNAVLRIVSADRLSLKKCALADGDHLQ